MVNNTTIRIEPEVELNNITVFDIGQNKEYVNKGLMQHAIRTDISKRLQEVFNKNEPQKILVSGYALERLEKESPETIHELKTSLKKNNHKLATQPYFGTSMHLLEEKDAIEHINRHQDLLLKNFGQQANTVLLDKEPSTTLLENINCTEFQIETETHHTTDMQKHLLEEMTELHSAIKETQDSALLQDFYMLANKELLKTVHESETEKTSPYEQYTTILTILNDMVHKINTAKLSERGEFQLETTISDTPSQLLKK